MRRCVCAFECFRIPRKKKVELTVQGTVVLAPSFTDTTLYDKDSKMAHKGADDPTRLFLWHNVVLSMGRLAGGDSRPDGREYNPNH